MDVKNMNFSVDFTAHLDWNPLEPGCWVDCPFSILTELGKECRASKVYRENGLIICPLVQYGIKER
jgi:hypothetical protein